MTRIVLPNTGDLTTFGRDLGTGTALPAAGPSASALRRGDVYYHADLGFMVYTGLAWRQRGGPHDLTAAQRGALTVPQGLHRGYQAYETDTGVLLLWSGTAWRVLDGGGHARYNSTGAAVTAMGTSVAMKVAFPTAEDAHPDISVDAANQVFTLNRAGLWHIDAVVNIGIATAGRFLVYINDGVGTTTYAAHATIPGAAGSIEPPVSTTKRFAAGSTISIGAYSTPAGSSMVSGARTNVAFTFLRS